MTPAEVIEWALSLARKRARDFERAADEHTAPGEAAERDLHAARVLRAFAAELEDDWLSRTPAPEPSPPSKPGDGP